ncbi:MAG: ATP-binding protein, partial [Vicingaceae bacterium]
MKDKKENNLDENYKRYKKFFDLSLDLLCIANVDGYFTLVNPAFSETLGWTVEEMISKPFLDFVHPDDVNSTIKEVEKLKDGIPTTSFINRYRTKSGEYVWMKWVSTPDQRTGELFAVAHNITDFIKNNQQLKQSIEFKDIFLANTSHEIRTPLNAILGFSDLLQKTALNKEQKEYVDTINLASQNLLVVVNDILDFAKIDAGKIELEQQPISIREVLSLVIKLAAPKFKTKHLKFITSIDQDLPKTVIGDAVRLTQILINLLNNAVKFTDKGNVEFKIISEETDENNVLITFSVKDTGIGISKEKLAVIFNRFEQVSGELEKTYGGSGLGLSIVKTLSDIHKAEITIDSELGKGSEFIVKIPYTLTLEKTSDELSLEINENGNNLLRNIKILIGEDNILNQKLVRELLLRHGAIVDLVGSGERCIEALKTKHYDVVLMDLQLPKINGKEATQIIRNELQKNIPIIACTADTTVNEKEKCLEAGMNGYVPKPYSDSMLVSEITRVLNVEQDDSVNDFNSENLSENVSSVSEVPLNKDNEARKLEEERITKEKAAAEAAKKAAAAAAEEEE